MAGLTPKDPPWLSLPTEVVEVLRPHVRRVAREVIDRIPGEVPDYARPMEGRFGDGVHRGVEVAFGSFLDLPGTDRPALSADAREVYVDLGRGEVRQGRSLDALLAAYRSGARTTFRELSGVAVRAGLDPLVVVALGESILAYIEELSAASAAGFAMEQSLRAGELDRRRAELVDMLVTGRGDEESVRVAVAAAAWHLPEQVVAAIVPLDQADGVRLAVGPGALVQERAADVVIVVPAPGDRGGRDRLRRELGGRSAWVGPTRPWREAPESLRLALLAQTVLHAPGSSPSPAGVAEDADVSRPLSGDSAQVGDEAAGDVEGREVEILLAAEPHLVDDLARRRLAPLAGLRPTQRERLAETLLAWLRHRGQRAPMAQVLAIHPQTVGYRVAQLRDLFGDQLEDPRARLELELVLRAGRR